MLIFNIKFQEAHQINSYWYFPVWILTILLLMGIFLIKGCEIPAMAYSAINDQKAIMSIIGEAENQGYIGMLAVAGAIRNRGTLKGVYGVRSKRWTKCGMNISQMARKAWFNSDKIDVTNGATGWGNASDIQIFKKQRWFNKCVITAHIGDHWFYKTKG